MKVIELPKGGSFKYYTPKELKAHLDEYIVGQEDAKHAPHVAIYNHYKGIILAPTLTRAGYVGDDVESGFVVASALNDLNSRLVKKENK